MMTGMGMGLGGLWMILIWLGMVSGSIWLLAILFPRQRDRQPTDTHTAESALTILRQRYVRGELTREEFDAIRRDLEQT